MRTERQFEFPGLAITVKVQTTDINSHCHLSSQAEQSELMEAIHRVLAAVVDFHLATP